MADLITIYAQNRNEAEQLLQAKGFPKSSIRINSRHDIGSYSGGTVVGTNSCAEREFSAGNPWVIVARK